MTLRRTSLLLLFSSLLSLLYGLYLMYVVLSPIYSLRGVFSGEIAIAWYRLDMYGEKIHISTLDTVRILGFPLYALGFLSIMNGLAGAYVSLRKPGLRQVMLELNLASALSGLIYSALLVQLGRIVAREVMYLNLDLVYTNNAGLVNFGKTSVSRLVTAELVEPGPVLGVTALYLVFVFISLIMESGENRKY